MRRRIQGLHDADPCAGEIPEGLFLIRIDCAQYRWHGQKPYYLIRFTVLEPKTWTGSTAMGRVYCTQKALWKLTWFLRDFCYDAELLGRDEIEEKSLVGLRGVVKIGRTVMNGRALLNLEGFGPASQWEEMEYGTNTARLDGSGVAS
jgi:hypothetical protein